MKTIKEYLLNKECFAAQMVYLPIGADVVALQDAGESLKLIVTINSATTLTELRTFKICTSNEILYADTIKYIGSFVSLIGTIHVVEIL